MQPVEISQGESPLVLAMPHTGTFLPQEISGKLNHTGLALADTDWHVDQLYQDLAPGATTVRAVFHRYVIDANRDPSGQSLYPGQNTTGLCPETDFEGRSLYKPGQTPDAAEVEERRQAFHAPYHTALQAELDRVKARHGIAVLYDCHSIRSELPFLFDGVLPDFNIGTNNGETCAPVFQDIVARTCAAVGDYTSVVNGRFRGGWTTRHYGDPANGVHAVQMELSQSAYMLEEAPWSYLPERAEALRAVLRDVLQKLTESALEYQASQAH